MKRNIYIAKSGVLSIVEGITASIAQKSGAEAGSFERLWASAGDEAKLDIWWRTAIGDLENNLRKHLAVSSEKFDLLRLGSDYRLTLTLSRYWDDRMTGLLENKIQEYLVDAVAAGWLAGFSGLTHPDYTSMAAGAMEDIIQLVLHRRFDFSTKERNTDTEKASASGLSATGRHTDVAKEANVAETRARGRQADVAKTVAAGAGTKATGRNKDNAVVRRHECETDWGNLGRIGRDRKFIKNKTF